MYLLFFLIRGRECYGRGLGLFLYLLFWSLVCVSCDAMCCYGDVTSYPSHPGLIRKALITNLLQLETFSLTERDSQRAATHRVLTERGAFTRTQREKTGRHGIPLPRTTSSLSTPKNWTFFWTERAVGSWEPGVLFGSIQTRRRPSRRAQAIHTLQSTVSLAHTRFYVHSRLQGLFRSFLYVMLYGG